MLHELIGDARLASDPCLREFNCAWVISAKAGTQWGQDKITREEYLLNRHSRMYGLFSFSCILGNLGRG